MTEIIMPTWLAITLIVLLSLLVIHALISDIFVKFMIKKYDLVEKNKKDEKIHS